MKKAWTKYFPRDFVDSLSRVPLTWEEDTVPNGMRHLIVPCVLFQNFPECKEWSTSSFIKSAQIAQQVLQLGNELEDRAISLSSAKNKFEELGKYFIINKDWTDHLWASFAGADNMHRAQNSYETRMEATLYRERALKRADPICLFMGLNGNYPMNTNIQGSMALLNIILFLDDMSDIEEDRVAGEVNSILESIDRLGGIKDLAFLVARSCQKICQPLDVALFLKGNALENILTMEYKYDRCVSP